MIQYKDRMVGFPNDLTSLQKSPTSISGEMNAGFYQLSRGLNPD